MVATGLKQLWTGQSAETFTAQGVSKGLQSVGTPPHYAGMVGGLTEIGVAGLPIGIVGKAGVKALHGGPVWQVGKHGSMPIPRPVGTQSHHGVNSVWM